MSTDPTFRRKILDFSPTGRARVVVVAILTTIACVVLSLWLTVSGIVPVDHAREGQQLAVNIITPILIAFPVMYFLMSKMRELAIAHHQLMIYAATDSLTQVMNRAAFSTLVEAFLSEARAAAETQKRGALLIIDADNFKAVNDRYGHDRGDEALIAIAQAIRVILRAPDIVGRLGGEEFGVFLPGATGAQAEVVAERIRDSVSRAPFAPSGLPHPLSVSVGGAVFSGSVASSELFRLADQQLYKAKRAGRDRVAILLDTISQAAA